MHEGRKWIECAQLKGLQKLEKHKKTRKILD
jgi:hypothetical protein